MAEQRTRGWYSWRDRTGVAFLAGGCWWLPCPGCSAYGRLSASHEALVGRTGGLTVIGAWTTPPWLRDSAFALTCPACGWRGTILAGQARLIVKEVRYAPRG